MVFSAQDWDELTGLGCMMFSTVMKHIGVALAESLVIKYFTSSAYIVIYLPTYLYISTYPTVHFTFLGCLNSDLDSTEIQIH